MQPVRILLVEDDYDMSFLTRKIVLQSLPAAEIVTVKAAEEGLARLRAETFDLVLTDLRLLGAMSGLDLIVELRRQAVRCPIIMLTSSDEMHHRALECGADDFVSTAKISEIGHHVKHLLLRAAR